VDLLKAGIIARARRVIGGEHDSTVKSRPASPVDVSDKWRKASGFKIEADASEKGVVKSASFTMPVAKGLINPSSKARSPLKNCSLKNRKIFLPK
jgi:hypothetical protein